MAKKKFAKSLIIVLFILGIAGYFVVEHMLPYAGIKPMRHQADDFVWLMPKGLKAENYGLRSSEISIRTPDQLSLRAILVPSNQDTTFATVVLLHGISACKEINFERAKMLAEAGYASLLLDLRAHGQSEGEYCTFGYYEKNDLHTVADTLAARYPKRPMGIWGASLGGAIALQAMALDKRYEFGIIESTFDEFEKVALEYGADWFMGIRSMALTRHVLKKSGEIAHFEPDLVKPVVAAAQIDRPILFMHGDKDARIPMWFGQRNYEACPATDKRWVKVPGAGHNNLWKIAGPALQKEVLDFLNHWTMRH